MRIIIAIITSFNLMLHPVFAQNHDELQSSGEISKTKMLRSFMLFNDTLPVNDKESGNVEIPNIQWYVKDSVLYISGEGDLPDIEPSKGDESPWRTNEWNVKKVVFSGKIKTIGNNMFGGHPTLESVVMCSSIERVGRNSFLACGKLQEVQWSDSLKFIGNLAFCRTSLRHVRLPNYVQFELGGAFHDCYALQFFSFPDSIKKTPLLDLGQSMVENFELQLSPVTDTISSRSIGSVNVNHVDIPSSVRVIEDSAFYYNPKRFLCRNKKMEKIIMHFTEQQLQQMNWGKKWGAGLDENIVTFIVPKGLKKVYEEFLNRKYNYNFVIEESDQ